MKFLQKIAKKTVSFDLIYFNKAFEIILFLFVDINLAPKIVNPDHICAQTIQFRGGLVDRLTHSLLIFCE